MGKLLDDPVLRNRTYVFADRAAAGKRLAQMLRDYQGKPLRLFAIPAGGVPVAAEIARALKVPLDLVIVRKIQLPWTTEAGFGALDPDGTPLFNEALLDRMTLSPQQIAGQVAKTVANLKEREEHLRGGRPYPDLAGATTIIVDDGLASGYTMQAAVGFAVAEAYENWYDVEQNEVLELLAGLAQTQA
jgi:putative phosphoribosyl transferase